VALAGYAYHSQSLRFRSGGPGSTSPFPCQDPGLGLGSFRLSISQAMTSKSMGSCPPSTLPEHPGETPPGQTSRGTRHATSSCPCKDPPSPGVSHTSRPSSFKPSESARFRTRALCAGGAPRGLLHRPHFLRSGAELTSRGSWRGVQGVPEPCTSSSGKARAPSRDGSIQREMQPPARLQLYTSSHVSLIPEVRTGRPGVAPGPCGGIPGSLHASRSPPGSGSRVAHPARRQTKQEPTGALQLPLPRPSLCCAVLCCAVLCCAVLCCAVLGCAVLCCAVLCCAVLCCAVLCCAVLMCCLLRCAALRCCARAVLCCDVLCRARGRTFGHDQVQNAIQDFVLEARVWRSSALDSS